MILEQEVELKKTQNEIDGQIRKIDKSAFVDGIINVEKYLKQSVKILWILKEPNSDDEKLNWRDEIKKLNNGTGNLEGFVKTFSNIVYTSYGILERKKWSEIKYIKDDPAIVEVLEKIAFINIKKNPGGSSSNDRELEEYYYKYRDIVKKQVMNFKPNVIIGGNTIKFLKEDLGKWYPNLKYNKYIEGTDLGISISNDENVIVFDARHPQNTSSTSEKYCDDIINNYMKLMN